MYFILLACLALFVVSLSISDFIILSSSSTPNSLISLLKTQTTVFNIQSREFSDIIDYLISCDFWLILDISTSPSYFPLLDSISLYFNTYYFTITRPSPNSFSSRRIHIHNSYASESKAISLLINAMNLQELSLLTSSLYENYLLCESIIPLIKGRLFSKLSYEENLSFESANDLVARMIKAKGVKTLLLVDYHSSLSTIQRSIKTKKLEKSGILVILISRGVYSAQINGTLIVVEQGLENSISLDDYELRAINNVINLINSKVTQLKVSQERPELINQVIRELFPTNIVAENYTVLNYIDNRSKSVGFINTEFVQTAEIGPRTNDLNTSTSITTKIPISIANGTHEIFNLNGSVLLPHWYQGARYAVERSNFYKELPRFSLDLFPTDCASFLYDPIWYEQCLNKSLNTLGVAYLTGLWDTVAYGNLITFRTLGVKIPQISALAVYDALNNKSSFPEFFKLTASLSEFFTNGFIFQKALGWRSINLITTDEALYYQEYLAILKFAVFAGISIVNPEDKRIFPANYSREQFSEYESYFQAAKDTRCRIFIILAYQRGMIWEGLYDIGLRRGDVIIIAESATMSSIDTEPEYLIKRNEIIDGAIIYKYREWVGELGVMLEKELSSRFSDTSYMCITYDSLSVIKEALMIMLENGDDYDDADALMNKMRKNKFTGCLGVVHFNVDSNSRSNSQFMFQQLLKNATGHWYHYDIAYVDLYSSKVINQVNEYIWHSSTTPTNFRPISICPFDDYLIQDSEKGKNVLIAMSFIFFIISIISSFCGFIKYKPEFVLLTQRKIISFSDMMFMMFFVFEFFQLLAVGPDQQSFRSLLSNVQILFGLDLNEFFQIKFEKFWAMLYVILLFVLIWVTCCILLICRCDVVFGHRAAFKILNSMTEVVLPFLGHICFLPIFSMLMNIFLCHKAIGPDLSESYMDLDCTTFCYRDKHLLYATLSCFCIVFYVISAAFCRSHWETTQTSLNVKTKSSYLAIITCFQVVAVLLNKVLKPVNQVAHGFILSGLLLVLILITLKLKPYNYQRVNAVQVFTLLLTFWGVFISAIFIQIPNIMLWVIFEFLGFICIVLFGIYTIRKHPGLLYTKEGIAVSTLIFFQFSKNSSAANSAIALSLKVQNNRKYQVEEEVITEK